ncbi:response regulator [Thaumasiovibrio subtropicus]|uniref:response regulator n=3 Tax=Thaumasiovibrio subtropicus TaxID=1891207 RepID=UPI001C84BE43|nr:response regulator [Thaumasiovibrio subtropicus]
MTQQDVDWESLSVLVVDDSKVASLMLKSELNKIGIKAIDVVENGDRAISKCQGKYYNFVLIDYHLEDSINGNELAHTLRSRHLIDRTCGVIIISGDNSSDVVLTVFSYNMDTFITKPIRAKELVDKLYSIKRNIDLLTPIYDQIDCGLIDEGVSELTAICLSDNSYKLESELLRILESNERWKDLDEWLTIKKHAGFNQRREYSKAIYFWQIEERSAAIRVLRNLISRMPRYVFAYDKLVEFYEELGKTHEALDIAEQSSRLTPTVSHRVLNLSRIAMEAGQIEVFLVSGGLLIKNLIIIDRKWFDPLNRYLYLSKKLIDSENATVSRNYILSKIKQMQSKVMTKLPSNQLALSKLLFYIYLARVAISENKNSEAHVRLMIGMKHFSSSLHALSDEILALCLVVAIRTGERWFVDNLIGVLSIRTQLTSISEELLKDANIGMAGKGGFFDYYEKLADLHLVLFSDPLHVIKQADELALHYPDSVELKLLKLSALVLSGKDKPIHFKKLLPKKIPLPESMHKWALSITDNVSELKSAHEIFIGELADSSKVSYQFMLTYEKTTKSEARVG